MRYFASYIALILAISKPVLSSFIHKVSLHLATWDCSALNGIVWSLNMHEIHSCHERPYDRENTASRLICEVKHVPVWIVVRWGTTREVQMLFFLFLLNFILSFLNLFFIFLILYKIRAKRQQPRVMSTNFFLVRFVLL